MTSSNDDGGVGHGVEWQWWMLLLIGYAGTAVVVGVVVSCLCIVQRCRACQTSRSARPDDEAEEEEEDAQEKKFSRQPSFPDEKRPACAAPPSAVAVAVSDANSLELPSPLNPLSTLAVAAEDDERCDAGVHTDGGLSPDGQRRLHLMRHADTADPDFGAFVTSSRHRR